MGKRLNLESLHELNEKRAAYTTHNFTVDGEEYTVKIVERPLESHFSQFITDLMEYVEEIKQYEIDADPIFWVALLENFTDIDFSNMDLAGKIVLIGEMVEANNLLTQVIESIPESVIKATTQRMESLAEFLKKEYSK